MTPEPAVFWRRAAALFYDYLLLIALFFAATAVILPLTDGEAIGASNPLYTSYLFLIAFGYYAIFWMRSGQTPGMRAWHIRVQRIDGKGLTLWHCLLRFLSAIPSWLLLFGIARAFIKADGLMWHDSFSETVVTRVDKNY